MRFSFPWKRPESERSYQEVQALHTGLARRALGILDLTERKVFLESEIRRAFDFRHVGILLRPKGPERFSQKSSRVLSIFARVLGILEGKGKPFLNRAIAKEVGSEAILEPLGATYAFPIRQGQTKLGILVIDSSPRMQLEPELEESLQALCNQVAIVLENSNLLEKKMELERELAQQAQMVQLGEMTVRIAHEIKNPLSSIKTIVQVMQEDPQLQRAYARDLELIKGELDRLGNSVVQLLDFARPVPNLEQEVFLHAEAESILDFLERDIQRAGATIANNIPAGLPPVMGNSSIFREIFLNLFLNALQSGTAPVHLWIRAQEGILEDGSERFVLLTVEDDGPGIPVEVQSKIFAPFFTTKQRGTGLGLAIVRRNVEHVGGHISLESPARENRGTRFLIHLPIAEREKGKG